MAKEGSAEGTIREIKRKTCIVLVPHLPRKFPYIETGPPEYTHENVKQSVQGGNCDGGAVLRGSHIFTRLTEAPS